MAIAAGLLAVAIGLAVASSRSGADCTEAPSGAGASCGYPSAAAPHAAPAPLPGAAAIPGPPVPVMLELLSRSCSACQRMEPVVERATHRCAGEALRVERHFVDDAAGAAYARRLGVFGIPTFLLLDGEGREVKRLVGEQPLAVLEGAMQELSGGRCRS